jgi:hypothetical protein
VRVAAGRKEAVGAELRAAGKPLAEHYLAATTQRIPGADQSLPAWWCSPGSPLAVIESVEDEMVLPRNARVVKELEFAGIKLCHVALSNGVSAWLLVRLWRTGVSGVSVAQLTRRLRIHLHRLHTERECVKSVLQLVARGKVTTDAGAENYDALQRYISEAQRLLAREWQHGLPQGDILKVAYESDLLVSDTERNDLLAALADARSSVKHKLRKLTASRVSLNVGNVWGGHIDMSNKETNITHSSIVGSTVVTADYAQRITNNVQGIAGHDDLKTALFELTALVGQLRESLPSDQRSEVEEDLSVLVEQAGKHKPRREWYELSAKGLVEAAKAVADLSAPIAQSVKTVLDLLGKVS